MSTRIDRPSPVYSSNKLTFRPLSLPFGIGSNWISIESLRIDWLVGPELELELELDRIGTSRPRIDATSLDDNNQRDLKKQPTCPTYIPTVRSIVGRQPGRYLFEYLDTFNA